MSPKLSTVIRGQLEDRRRRLQSAMSQVGQAGDLVELLHSVDAALDRLQGDHFGQCDVCHTSVEDEVLLRHPTIQYCLCELSDAQRAALERDLSLARRTQLALLPPQDLSIGGWQIHFRFQPAGPVSGDYLDIVTTPSSPDTPHLFLGDVSGKGVAASLLMARLSALIRTLIEQDLPLDHLVDRADRHFAENTPSSHFATLVAARAEPNGTVHLCNAGHCPPQVVRAGHAAALTPGGLPVGIGADEPRASYSIHLDPGDTLFLYTDGFTEAMNSARAQYGPQRLASVLERHARGSPAALAAACLADQASFLDGTPRQDDLTLMVVHREP